MDYQPKSIISRILEFSVLLLLSAFIIRLAVCFIMEVWWELIIVALVVVGGLALYRIWKHKTSLD